MASPRGLAILFFPKERPGFWLNVFKTPEQKKTDYPLPVGGQKATVHLIFFKNMGFPLVLPGFAQLASLLLKAGANHNR